MPKVNYDDTKRNKPKNHAALLTQENYEAEPVTYEQAIKSNETKEWEEAIQEELKAFLDNDTFRIETLKEPPANLLETKWVFKRKFRSDATLERYKARCVVKGYMQVDGIDYDSAKVTSPVLRSDSLRVILAIIANQDLETEQIDIKTAFQVPILDETIYVKPPKGIHKLLNIKDNQYLRLYKSLYGTKQASLLWHLHFTDTIIKLGFKASEWDPCVYIRGRAIITIYVDDNILAAPAKHELNEIIKYLEGIYTLTKLGPVSYILGVKITRNRTIKRINLSQMKYINSMAQRFSTLPEKQTVIPFHEPAQTKEKSNVEHYQQILGSTNYALTITRPDISFTNNYLARRLQAPTVTDTKSALKLISYLYTTKEYDLVIEGDLNITAYSDASLHDDLTTGRSTGGIVLFLGKSPVIWKSKRQATVALSSTEAELYSAVEATKEVIWLQNFLKELGFTVKTPTILYQDNKSTIITLTQPKINTRMKHINIRTHWIKEILEKNLITIKYIPTTENIADILTKGLAFKQHWKLMNNLNLKTKLKTTQTSQEIITPNHTNSQSKINIINSGEVSELINNIYLQDQQALFTDVYTTNFKSLASKLTSQSEKEKEERAQKRRVLRMFKGVTTGDKTRRHTKRGIKRGTKKQGEVRGERRGEAKGDKGNIKWGSKEKGVKCGGGAEWKTLTLEEMEGIYNKNNKEKDLGTKMEIWGSKGTKLGKCNKGVLRTKVESNERAFYID